MTNEKVKGEQMFDYDRTVKQLFQKYLEVMIDEFAELVPKLKGKDGKQVMDKLESADYRDVLEDLLSQYNQEYLEVPPLLKRDVALVIFDYYDQSNQWSTWIEIAKIGLKACEEMQDNISTAKLLANMGKFYRMMGKIEEALDCFNQVMSLTEQTDEKVDALIGMCDIYRLGGKIEKAIDYGKKALELSKNDVNRSTKALMFLGLAYVGSLDYDQGIECYLKAIDKCKQANSFQSIATDYSRIAFALAHRAKGDDLLHALEYYHQARMIEEEIGNKQGLARLNGDIAVAYNKLKRYEEAITLSQKALELNEDIGYERGVVLNKARLVCSHFELALELAIEVVEEFEELSMFDRVNLGSFYEVLPSLVHYAKANKADEIAEKLNQLLI